MATVNFTANLRRHVHCPQVDAEGNTVATVLQNVFEENPVLKGYVVDEHGALRKHMVIFVDGIAVTDRTHLSDPVPGASSQLFVMQALSGG